MSARATGLTQEAAREFDWMMDNTGEGDPVTEFHGQTAQQSQLHFATYRSWLDGVIKDNFRALKLLPRTPSRKQNQRFWQLVAVTLGVLQAAHVLATRLNRKTRLRVHLPYTQKYLKAQGKNWLNIMAMRHCAGLPVNCRALVKWFNTQRQAAYNATFKKANTVLRTGKR